MAPANAYALINFCKTVQGNTRYKMQLSQLHDPGSIRISPEPLLGLDALSVSVARLGSKSD